MSQGTPLRRILESGSFSFKNAVLIGAHGPVNTREEADWVNENNIRVYTAREIGKRGIEEVAGEAIERVWAGTKGVYLSVDLDCLDAKDQ